MPELDLSAELRLEVTTPAGQRTTALITGRGQELRVDADRPEVLLGAVDTADVGRIAELLSATGLTVRVFGPAGLAGTIGAGASSRLGKLVTGSSAVAPSFGGAARSAVATWPVRQVAIATLAAAAVVAILRLLRRR